MRKNNNKKGKNTKSYDDEEKSYLISYFYDYYNSFSGERKYYIKNELVERKKKKDAYDHFRTLYPSYGIINIIPLDD